MSTPIAREVLFRGDAVVVDQAMFSASRSEAERRMYVHTTMRPGDTDVELCDNPYHPDPAKLDYLPISRLTLVRRGNWFRVEHNTPPLFDEPSDEPLFWRYWLGVTEVRNPAMNGQANTWTRQQALNGLSAGIADLFVVKGGSSDEAGECCFEAYKFRAYKSDRIPGGIPRLRELNRDALRAMAP